MLLQNFLMLLRGNVKGALCQMKRVATSIAGNLVEIFFLYIIFTLVFCQFDHTHWVGIDEEDDDTFNKKFFNRFYFTSTTYSTAGYGDISPKSTSCRIAVMALQTLIIVEIVNLALHVKPGQ